VDIPVKKFLAMFTLIAILCGGVVGCGDDKPKATPAKDKDAKDKDAKDKKATTTP